MAVTLGLWVILWIILIIQVTSAPKTRIVKNWGTLPVSQE